MAQPGPVTRNTALPPEKWMRSAFTACAPSQRRVFSAGAVLDAALAIDHQHVARLEGGGRQQRLALGLHRDVARVQVVGAAHALELVVGEDEHVRRRVAHLRGGLAHEGEEAPVLGGEALALPALPRVLPARDVELLPEVQLPARVDHRPARAARWRAPPAARSACARARSRRGRGRSRTTNEMPRKSGSGCRSDGLPPGHEVDGAAVPGLELHPVAERSAPMVVHAEAGTNSMPSTSERRRRARRAPTSPTPRMRPFQPSMLAERDRQHAPARGNHRHARHLVASPRSVRQTNDSPSRGKAPARRTRA